MKRSLTLFFIMLIAAGFMFSQSIKIIQPAGGENLQPGQSYTIKWNAAGTKNPFKITLWKDGRLVGLLKEKSAGDGNKGFNWKVGELGNRQIVKNGTGYYIKIKEKSTSVSDISKQFDLGVKKTPQPPAPPKKPDDQPGNTMIPQQVQRQTHQIQTNQFQLKDPPKSIYVLEDSMLPDLSVFEIKIVDTEPTPIDVDTVKVNIIVKNNGKKDLEKWKNPFTVKIRNKSGWGGTNTTFYGGLKAGYIMSFEMKVSLHRDLKGFIPEYIVTLDSENKVKETDETNNTKDFKIKIQ